MKGFYWTLFVSLLTGYSSYAQNTFPANGNVGIGTLAPIIKFQVNAGADINLGIRDGQTDGTAAQLNAFNNSGTISVPMELKASKYNFTVGNVGIGTTNPVSPLHLNTTTIPSSTGTVMLTIQAPHTSSTLGSGGIIKFTNNIATADAAAIRTFTDGAGLVSLRFQTGYGTGLLTDQMTISNAGNVSIGTANGHGYKFAVNGNAIATSMTVKLYANWPDYVFKKDYQLPSLTEVKTYIDQNHHLPEMPSAQEVAKDGLNLGEMNKLLVKKVEELTLYLIENQKQVQLLQSEINEMKNAKKP